MEFLAKARDEQARLETNYHSHKTSLWTCPQKNAYGVFASIYLATDDKGLTNSNSCMIQLHQCCSHTSNCRPLEKGTNSNMLPQTLPQSTDTL